MFYFMLLFRGTMETSFRFHENITQLLDSSKLAHEMTLKLLMVGFWMFD